MFFWVSKIGSWDIRINFYGIPTIMPVWLRAWIFIEWSYLNIKERFRLRYRFFHEFKHDSPV
ncbi:hypothetical protein CH365_10115 [Leptospira neocaledonica]|uniref:Uncharacterized protein n=1 Tax=Leptospira neocaledonica TaxID=2023192 RepID=A0A2M9ZYE9_9LEPT|nr:hypothetical protein CH365_10115 [Leptospira neocaledonica]